MPQELIRDEEIRLQCWNVFRSSSRDHMVPMTSGGRVLQKIRINSALPSTDVVTGVVLSAEEQELRRKARAAAIRQAEQEAMDRPLGVSQYLGFHATTVNAALPVGEPNDHQSLIALAPFDGYITEMVIVPDTGLATYNLAIRTSGGQTMFRSLDSLITSPPGLSLLPDFIDMGTFSPSGEKIQVRNLKMPVFAGEEIYFVGREFGSVGPGVGLATGMLGFEGFILARPGSAAAQSQFLALTAEARAGARDAANMAGRVAIEREKTRRAEIEGQARVQVAQLAAEVRRPPGIPMNNPFNQVLIAPNAQPTIQRRQPVAPPPPQFEAPPAVPTSGKGMTFVQAWQPANGSIGYMIPDPPPGGRVNVFDGKYTIWDVTGKNIGSGPVQNVASTDDIPGGARVSRNLGGKLSPGMAVSSGGEGGFTSGTVVQAPSGRQAFVPTGPLGFGG